jgi:hypothetical protein
VEITKQLLYVGRMMLGAVIIIFQNVCADVTVDVGETSCGVDEVEGVVYGIAVS